MTARRQFRHALHKRLRRAVCLAEELSPRTELLDLWTKELQHVARRLQMAPLEEKERKEKMKREEEMQQKEESQQEEEMEREEAQQRG